MALTQIDVSVLLSSDAKSIEIRADGSVEIIGARDTAGALFQDVDMVDYSWIDADLEDDRGYYRETTFYERSPEEAPDGIGYVISGLYRRNTDIYDNHTIEASFEGFIVETNAETHEQKREEEAARFLDQTISLKVENLEKEAKDLARCFTSRSSYKGNSDVLGKMQIEGVKNINRTIAMIYARKTP